MAQPESVCGSTQFDLWLSLIRSGGSQVAAYSASLRFLVIGLDLLLVYRVVPGWCFWPRPQQSDSLKAKQNLVWLITSDSIKQ